MPRTSASVFRRDDPIGGAKHERGRSWTYPGMMAEQVRTVRLMADVAEVAVARRFVRSSFADLSPTLSADAELIVSELFTNAVEHGVGGSVVVELHRNATDFAIVVESVGPSPNVGEVSEWHVTSVDQLSGRGLGIVRSVADHVEIVRQDGRLVISASLLC